MLKKLASIHLHLPRSQVALGNALVFEVALRRFGFIRSLRL